MKPFRIAAISLDEDHDVSGITAVIDAPYIAPIEGLIGAPLTVLDRQRGDTEIWVELPTAQMMQLFRAVGNQAPADADYIPGVYEPLTLVVYGLMED